jgi:intracellular septation protein
MTDSPRPQMSTSMRMAIEMGPLVLFLIASGKWGIYVATVGLMVAVSIALVVSYRMERGVRDGAGDLASFVSSPAV